MRLLGVAVRRGDLRVEQARVGPYRGGDRIVSRHVRQRPRRARAAAGGQQGPGPGHRVLRPVAGRGLHRVQDPQGRVGVVACEVYARFGHGQLVRRPGGQSLRIHRAQDGERGVPVALGRRDPGCDDGGPGGGRGIRARPRRRGGQVEVAAGGRQVVLLDGHARQDEVVGPGPALGRQGGPLGDGERGARVFGRLPQPAAQQFGQGQ